MRRRILMVFLGMTLAVGAPAATAREDDPPPGILDSEGISARLVRHGCGKRLYHVAGRLIVSHGKADFLPEAEGVRVRASRTGPGCRTVARRSDRGSWSLVAEGGVLPFPELIDPGLFESRFKAVAGKPGTFEPGAEADRKLLDQVSITRDRSGRPLRVRLSWADGNLEVREYSNWAVAAPREIEPAEATGAVAWPPESAWGSHLETALEGLQRKLGKLDDLAGEFVREKRTFLLNRPVTSTGRFVFVPGRILWIDEAPRPSEVLITRTGMEIHDPDNRRLERFAFGDQALGRYVFLGFGDSLAEGLRAMDPVVFTGTGDELRLELVPVGGELGRHVKRISFVFDPGTGMLRELGYSDPSGDSVTTRFTTIEKNTGVDPETVAIRPAPGTKIVTNSGGMPWR